MSEPYDFDEHGDPKPELAEIARLERWIDDLQSGMWINCVYCGHRYGPGDVEQGTMREALHAHVEQCPKHPMAVLRRRVDQLEHLAGAASHALRSYQHGNVSSELAEEIADRIDEVLDSKAKP